MSEHTPRTIGPYTLIERIGEGGMGEVWRARQREPVDREVALKLVRGGGPSDEVMARFHAERQALAVLDHPNLAHLFDAGETDDGLPYFVMELVDGMPILEYADRARLGIPDRIRLFQDVCRGVQHAHQKGLIHRDLKPSNILVSEKDGRPFPKVIDFGIAKAVQADVDLTQDVNTTLGTPAYMAPEQLEDARNVDTRVDIYALGVVLYELLAGTKPFEPGAYRGSALLATVLVSDPPLLTRRFRAQSDPVRETAARDRKTEPHGLERALKGDLEWIVARCLEKDRDRRYETANGLVLDLRRYLSFEPILARPHDTGYRVRKFVRRHRFAVGSAAVIAVLLVGFAVTTLVQNGRIRDARDLADRRRESAEDLLVTTISELWGDLEPLGQLPLLNNVADAAVGYFSSLPAEDLSDQELASRSQLLYQIGDVRLDEGNLEAAQAAFDESLRLARLLSRRAPDDDQRLFGLGQSEFYAGDLRRRLGQLDSATAHWERYRDISIELNERDPANLDFLMEVGYSHTNLGGLLRIRGEAEAALEEFRRSATIKERVYEADPEDRRLYDLSRSYNTVGIALYDLGRVQEAREWLRRDIGAKEELVTRSPENALYLARLAASLAYLDLALHAMGDGEAALGAADRSVEIYRRLVRLDASNIQWRRNLAVQTARLAVRQGAARGSGAGEAAADDAVDLMRSAFREMQDEPEAYLSMAAVLQARGAVSGASGLDDRRAAAREALEVAEAGAEVFPSRAMEQRLAEVLLVLGDLEDRGGEAGGPRWTRALELLGPEEAPGEHHERLALRVALLKRLERDPEADRLRSRLQEAGITTLPGLND